MKSMFDNDNNDKKLAILDLLVDTVIRQSQVYVVAKVGRDYSNFCFFFFVIVVTVRVSVLVSFPILFYLFILLASPAIKDKINK